MIFSCTHKLYMINLSLSSVFSYFITVFYFMAHFLCLKAEKCRLYHGLMEGLFCYVAQIHHYFWRLFSVGATIGRQQIVGKKITGDQWSPYRQQVMSFKNLFELRFLKNLQFQTIYAILLLIVKKQSLKKITLRVLYLS